METIEYDQNQNQPESSPFQQICPRHGVAIRPFHGCPECIMEEVRRHERRFDDLFQREEPMATDPIDQADAVLDRAA